MFRVGIVAVSVNVGFVVGLATGTFAIDVGKLCGRCAIRDAASAGVVVLEVCGCRGCKPGIAVRAAAVAGISGRTSAGGGFSVVAGSGILASAACGGGEAGSDGGLGTLPIRDTSGDCFGRCDATAGFTVTRFAPLSRRPL